MLLTAFAFCITISCSDKSASDPTGPALNDSTAAAARVASATVTLAQSTLEVGQTTQATALLLDRYNNPLTLAVVWSSSDSSLATVSGSGLVTARSPGTVSIVATRGGKSGAATLTVLPSTVTVASVTVSLAASSLTVGQTTRATATLRDSSNNVLSGRPVVWASSNMSVATSSDSGIVTALAAGSTQISASSGGQTGAAPLSVTAVSPVPVASVTVTPSSATLQIGASVQLQVSAFDSSNNVLTGRVVTSSSANPAIASVNSLGLVTAVGAGTTQITVTSEGKSAIATITVSTSAPPPTNPGTVTNLQASVTGSSSVTLSFTQVDDGTGQPAKYDVRFAVAPISWGSATSATTGTCTTPLAGTAIGSQISCTVLGLAPATNYNFQLIAFRGTLNLNAVFGSLSNMVSATTTASAPVPVASVSVSPASSSLLVGATAQLTAVTRDASNNVLAGRVVTWSSANTSIASVNSSGLVSAVGAGSTTITATSETKTGAATVNVQAAPPPPPPPGLLFEEDFENTSIASRGWYDNTNVQLSTVEHIAGSTASAQYHFLAGATSPTSGGAQRHKFTPSNSFYLSYYVKYSTNWVGSGTAYHPHEFYALSTLDGDWDGPSNNFLDVYVEHNYQNGGRPRIEIQDNKSVNYSYGALPNNLIAVTENRSAGGCNGVVEANIFSECFNFGTYWYNDKQLTGPVVFQPDPGVGYKNNWNFVEAYFQLNTIVNGIGQADGVVQYWFNGTLILDRHDILFRTGAHPTLQFNQFLIAPYIGDGSPVDQSMWIDNLRVATARIP